MAFRLILALVLLGLAANAEAQSFLRGSPGAMLEQYRKAQQLDLDRMKNPSMIRRYVAEGYLVRITTTSNYIVDRQVSFPYARPSVKLFLDRFGSQHKAACGERPTVVSLTRPLNKQPRNASKLSVHPAGMSVDFRMPKSSKCRAWMEKTFNHLENGVRPRAIQVTRERRPPHFHVAVYPDNYRRYIASLNAPKKPVVKASNKKPSAKPVVKKAVRNRR